MSSPSYIADPTTTTQQQQMMEMFFGSNNYVERKELDAFYNTNAKYFILEEDDIHKQGDNDVSNIVSNLGKLCYEIRNCGSSTMLNTEEDECLIKSIQSCLNHELFLLDLKQLKVTLDFISNSEIAISNMSSQANIFILAICVELNSRNLLDCSELNKIFNLKFTQ
jgi:hypothetical protein